MRKKLYSILANLSGYALTLKHLPGCHHRLVLKENKMFN